MPKAKVIGWTSKKPVFLLNSLKIRSKIKLGRFRKIENNESVQTV